MLVEWFPLLAEYPWMIPVLQILALLLGAWIFRVVLLHRLRALAKKTASELDDQLIHLMERAVGPLLILGVLAASLNILPLPPRFLSVMNHVVYLGAIAVALYFGSKAAQLVLERWLARTSARDTLHEPVQFLMRVIVAAFGLMILLDNLGISLTAVWTTLGVGSVAIALALQDTLGNFFAGVYLRIDSPVRLGDYIQLDSGEGGHVEQIGWRSTRIRTLPNNTVVIPNAKLSSSIITNYSMPEPQMSLLIPVGVSYGCDPVEIERVLLEVAKKGATEIEGLLSDPEPFVRFSPGFGDSSLDFTLICRVNTFVDQYYVQHELRKRVFARFRSEGIEIPFPQRDVHLYTHNPAQAAATAE